MKLTRTIAGLLAASGAIFSLIAWMLPPFWPGYLVWVGWIAVAAGSRELNARWFWVVSAVWNGAMLWFFFAETDRSGGGEASIYWYARGHLCVATLVSVYLSVLGPREGHSETEKPNKAPEPTPGPVTPRADARVAPAPVVAHL